MMTWRRSQRRSYLVLLTIVLSLGVVAMLSLNGPPPMANDQDDAVQQLSQNDLTKAVDLNGHSHVFETALVAMEAQVDLGNGVLANAFTINGTIPGPLIRVKVGDKVIVHFTNNLPIPASIHWHGIELTNRSDGTGITQNPVLPGETYVYDFIVPRAGVYFYHSHIAPTNPEFKGYYGPLIVEDRIEKKLIEYKVIPKWKDTKVLVLGDTTVCKQPGSNDAVTYPPDATGNVPWAGGALFPGKNAAPSPQTLCEQPLDEHGHFITPVVALAAGSIPNVQPTPDCGSAGNPACPTNEGQLVLTNGKVAAARAGSPSAPGLLSAGAAIYDARRGQGIRLQLGSAAIIRYFRLRLTDQLGNQVTLFRIGGQGGVLDNVRVEGGTQGTLNTQYDPGEILLPVAAREDVVFVVPAGANEGDVLTLWTLDYQRNGGGQGNDGFGALPTVPVAHFKIVDKKKDKFTIAAGDPLRTHAKVHEPIESLKLLPVDALLDSSLFVPSQLGSTDSTIKLTAAGKPGINGQFNFIFDEGPTPPALFTDVPHVTESRFAAVGDLLELTIFNDTAAHHPWHPHGFSIQPVRITDAGGATLFSFPYNEFVDVVDIPPHAKLVYRVRLDDRPFDFATPTGGAVGRWAMHCHIFFHAALGMITELVAVGP